MAGYNRLKLAGLSDAQILYRVAAVQPDELYQLGRMSPAEVIELPTAARKLRMEKLHHSPWGMTPDQLRAAIPTMPERHLCWLTRGHVDLLDPALRELRKQRMLDEPVMWTIDRVSEFLDMGSAVARWRWRYLRTSKSNFDAFPAPDNESAGRVRMPGTPRRGRDPDSDPPLWYPPTVYRWLRLYGPAARIDEDFVPRPGGRKPPGRNPVKPVGGLSVDKQLPAAS